MADAARAKNRLSDIELKKGKDINKYFKFKRVLALLCTITLVLCLCTVFASAAEAEREEELRSTSYVVADNTFIYANQGGSGATTSVSKRAIVSSSTSSGTWASNLTSSSGNHWPDASRKGVSGYMWDRKICPKQHCYKVFNVSSYLYNSASTSSGYKYNFSFPIGTIMYSIKVDNQFSPTFRYVHMLYNGSVYTGWMLIGQTASESGVA